MIPKPFLLILLLALGIFSELRAQESSTTSPKIVDVVWLRGGSKLTGTILKWELARGMEFKLATGAVMIISRNEIVKVYQDVTLEAAIESTTSSLPVVRGPRPYEFREHGLYQTFSGFLNIVDPGGAGLHYSIGHRFSRMLGVGAGLGIESNDLFNNRDLIPVFAEARGYFKAEKISPYYAMKIGYGFALKHEFNNTIDAKGGIYISPELGIRFGGRSVNFYIGAEYKLQKATYVEQWWEGTFTDKITYKRLELRTGLLF